MSTLRRQLHDNSRTDQPPSIQLLQIRREPRQLFPLREMPLLLQLHVGTDLPPGPPRRTARNLSRRQGRRGRQTEAHLQIQMSHMRQILSQILAPRPHQDAHPGEALRLQGVQRQVRQEEQPAVPREEPREEGRHHPQGGEGSFWGSPLLVLGVWSKL